MAHSSASATKRTLASSTHDALRKEIIAGQIEADSRLNIRHLAARFEVGLAPIREALSRLSTEGLVTQTDHRGFTVVPVSVEELWDLHHARVQLNALALRQSIARGDAAWEERIVVARHRLLRSKRPADDVFDPEADQWAMVHKDFHHALLSACESARILRYCDQLFDECERYRHIARRVSTERPGVSEEHRAIAEAAIDREADLAIELLTEHFRRTAERAEQGLVARAAGSVTAAD
ncbi:GntR family transcriptional regulator [Nocardia sp. NPDC051570]|uniref:GntR family transcriptional regulator n=1 Tax=Nocardia sp. NPDC051570 TaxID=3364324 RepID=UPI0037BCBE16